LDRRIRLSWISRMCAGRRRRLKILSQVVEVADDDDLDAHRLVAANRRADDHAASQYVVDPGGHRRRSDSGSSNPRFRPSRVNRNGESQDRQSDRHRSAREWIYVGVRSDRAVVALDLRSRWGTHARRDLFRKHLSPRRAWDPGSRRPPRNHTRFQAQEAAVGHEDARRHP
jgi:hypothetical protein